MDQHVFASEERVGHQAVEPLEGRQYRAFAEIGGHEAAPMWCATFPVPVRGWDVNTDIDHQRDGDLVEEREVIGA